VINPTTKLMFFRENIPSTETLIYIYTFKKSIFDILFIT
jgi:hypothetical protein